MAIPGSRHQNDGSRIVVAAFETNLHEIRIERGKGAIERATQGLDSSARGSHDRRARARILQPGAHAYRKLAHIGYLLGPARLVQRGVDFGKVPDMWTVQDGGAELDRLNRILAPMTCEPAANEDNRCQPIDQHKLSN